ncbi:MAG: ATP-binding protein, partial [Mycobacterium sp.]
TLSASTAALTERRRSRADIDGRIAAIAGLQTASDEAAAELTTAGEAQAAADEAAGQARSALEAGQARVDAARSAVQRLTDGVLVERLTSRLTAIESHQRALDVVQRDLAASTLTDELMQTIEDADGVLGRAVAAAEQASSQVELVAEADLELRIGGETIALRPGAAWSAALSGPAGIEVPGVLSIQVTPGASAATTAAVLDTAQAALSEALQRAGAPDVSAARALQERRRELLNTGERLQGILDALTEEGGADELRSQLSELGSGLPIEDGLWNSATGPPQEPDELRAELDTATTVHQQVVRDCETQRRRAEEAAKLFSERGVRAARAKEKWQAAQAELALAEQRLEAERRAASDDQLAIKAEADAETSAKAAELVASLGSELASRQPELVAVELADAERDAVGVQQRHDQAAAALREVAIQLSVYGTEGRKGRLDAAEADHQHAAEQFARVQRRARAARLLSTVMGRHRHAMRQRYVDPFRGEVERLGRLVFGETFEVDVDSELRIGHRTVSGRTVPYESLSGGAKEQLGIVARLAGAALVAKEDAVPVVIDDALGFTDAERLAKMAEVFDTVASDSQVIILTCSPQRYAGVRCAQHIELAATGSG